jgi:F0F1-type ATP synthase assembly protein I
MSLPSEPNKEPRNAQMMRNMGLYSVGMQVGCVTILIVFLSLGIGLGLDSLLNTKPVFTLIFILSSAPVALYLTFKLAMRAVKNANPQSSSSAVEKEPAKEEEKRE